MTEKKSILHFFKPGIVLVLGIWMLLGIQTTVYAEESGDDGAVVALDGTEQKQTINQLDVGLLSVDSPGIVYDEKIEESGSSVSEIQAAEESVDTKQSDSMEITNVGQVESTENTDVKQPESTENTDVKQPESTENTDVKQPESTENADVKQLESTEITDAKQPENSEIDDVKKLENPEIAGNESESAENISDDQVEESDQLNGMQTEVKGALFATGPTIIDSDATDISISEGADLIIDIVSDSNNGTNLAITNGNVTTRYKNTSTITSLSITANKITLGNNAKTAALGTDKNYIKMTNANVWMKAKNILLISDENKIFEWFLRSLNAYAGPQEWTKEGFFVSDNDYNVMIVNQEITASDIVNIVASNKKNAEDDSSEPEEIVIDENTDKSTLDLVKEDAGNLFDDLGTIADELGLYVAVKTEDVGITIKNSSITASDIKAITSAKFKTNVTAAFAGITTAVIASNSKVAITDSVLTANGTANNSGCVTIQAKTNAILNSSCLANMLPFAFSLQLIMGDTSVDIVGTKITAKNNIEIMSDRCIEAKETAAGKNNNYTQKGVFIAISVFKGDSKVTVIDSTNQISSLDADGDIKIHAEKYEDGDLSSAAQGAHFDTVAGSFQTDAVTSTTSTIISQLSQVLEKNVTDKLYSWFVKVGSSALHSFTGFIKDKIVYPISNYLKEAASASANTLNKITLKDTIEDVTSKGDVRVVFRDDIEGSVSAFPIGTKIELISSDKKNVFTYICNAETKEHVFKDIPKGDYYIYITMPEKYNQLSPLKFTAMEKKCVTLEASVSMEDYSKTQFAASFGVSVIDSDSIVNIDTKGNIHAGKKFDVAANTISMVKNTVDGTGIDTVLQEVPEDGNIYTSMTTPNQEEVIPTTFYITNNTDEYYTRGTISDFSKSFKAAVLKNKAGLLHNIKEGVYKYYFCVPYLSTLQYEFVGGKYEEVKNKPAFMSDDDWNRKDVKWYYGTIELKKATRQLCDLNGKPVYDILGTPLMEEFVKGEFPIVTLKQKDTQQGDIPADRKVIGVSIGVNVASQDTEAIIKNANIKAGSMNVSSASGVYNGTFKPAKLTNADGSVKSAMNSSSTVTSTAGFSQGEFGLAGSIAVNVVDDKVKSTVENVTIVLTGGNTSITATNNYDLSTTAKGTSKKAEKAATGVGAGIAMAVLVKDTDARFIDFKQLTGGNDLTVKAEGSGSVTTSSTAGAKGGSAYTPALGVVVIVSDTNAFIQGSNTLDLKGNLAIKASSDVKSNLTADASAVGHDVAAGGTVLVDVGIFEQNAVLGAEVKNAASIAVDAIAKNTAVAKAVAGADGAAPKIPVKTVSGSSKEEKAPSTDDSMNQALKSAANIVNNADKEKVAKVPTTTPQSAETAEGSVDVAGSLVLVVLNNSNKASVLKNTNVVGNLGVSAQNSVNVTAESDASSVMSSNGVGAAVAIVYTDIKNIAEVKGTQKAGTLTVKAVNPTAEVKNEDGTTSVVPVKNYVTIQSLAGAGASNVGVAGSVAVNVYNEKYDASVENAELTASGDSELTAKSLHEMSIYSGASADNDGGATSVNAKPTGVGASFGANFAFYDVYAHIVDGSKFTSKGNLTIQAITDNKFESVVKAGTDAYWEPAKASTITIKFVDSNGTPIEGVVVGDGIGTTTRSDKTGAVNFEFVEGKTYNLRIHSVPAGFQMPDSDSFGFTATKEGYLKTVHLYRTNQIKQSPYASVDAAVAMNLIKSDVHAVIPENVILIVDKNLVVKSEADTESNAEVRSDANAENTAAGASVAVNIAAENTLSELASNTTVGGNLTVTAETKTSDKSGAYATASGVQLDRLKDQFGLKATELLDKNFFTRYLTKPLPTYAPTTNVTKYFDMILKLVYEKTDFVSDQNFNIASKILSVANVSVSQIKAIIKYAKDTKTSAEVVKSDAASAGEVTTDDSEKMTIAAAVAVNGTAHSAKANVMGNILMANGGDVIILAKGTNNYKAMASGESCTSDTAIAAAAAIALNQSKIEANLLGNIGNSTSKAGNIKVEASAVQNLNDGFKDDVTAQAIAGAGKGNEPGGLGIAGAFAGFINNQKVTATIGDGVVIYSAGDVNLDATEKSKISARAWGAELSSPLFKDQKDLDKVGGAAGSGKQPGKGAGVGAAFAVIYANNETKANVGNNVTIYAKTFTANAEKQKVTSDDYSYDGFDINGVINLPTKPSHSILINTTGMGGRDKQEDNNFDVHFDELLQQGINLLNYFASANYYVEAAGGAVGTNSSFQGAGSFSVLYMNDKVSAVLGDNVKLVLDKDAVISSKADEKIVLIGGALSYGSKASAGMASTAVINNQYICSEIGNYFDFTGGNLNVTADLNTSVTDFLVAAATAITKKAPADTSVIDTSTAVDGVLNVYVGNADVIALIKENAKITAADIKIAAKNNLAQFGAVGGASLGNGKGGGASANVVILDGNVMAAIYQGAEITADSLVIDALQDNDILDIVVNGAVAAGKDAGATISVSPTVYVVTSKTYALLGTKPNEAEGICEKTTKVNLKKSASVNATDNTNIITAAGAVGITTGGSGVGGSVDVTVLLKEVKAIVAEGTEVYYVSVIAPEGLSVTAKSTEDIEAFVFGLGAGDNSSASGSISVLVVENDVLSNLGNYAKVGNENSRGNVNLSASDQAKIINIAGAAGLSISGNCVGISNADLIFDGTTKARIGNNSIIFAKNVNVNSKTDTNTVSVAVSGAAATKTTVTGSVITTVLNQTTESIIGENVNITADENVNVETVYVSDTVDVAGFAEISISGNAVGTAVDTIVFGAKNLASIGKGTVISAKDVSVSASSDEKMVNIVAGVGGSGGTANVQGSVSTIVKNMYTAAAIGTLGENAQEADATGVKISTDGNASVISYDNADIVNIAGNLGLNFGNANIGAGVITMVDNSKLISNIGKGAVIDASGNGSPKQIPIGDAAIETVVCDNGNASINYRRAKRNNKSVTGVIVGAFGNNALNLIAISGGGSAGTAGVNAAVATLVQNNIVQSTISTNAAINANNREHRTKSSVTVAATSDTDESATAGSGAIGGTAGVSAAVVTFTGKSSVKAEIAENSIIYAGSDITITAIYRGNLYINSIGAAAGGVAGVGADSSVLVFESLVEAKSASSLTADTGSIVIYALSDSFVELAGSSINGAGTAAVGAAIGVIVFKGKTHAYLASGINITAGKDITIIAFSNEKITGAVAGIGGAGTAAVGGSVAVVVMNIETTAVIDDYVTVNANGTLTISAADKSDIITVVGGVSAAGVASVGIAVETTVYQNTVTAKIGNYNHVTVGAVNMTAVAERKINSHGAMISASGAAAVQGSVIVLNIGSSTDDENANSVDGHKDLTKDAVSEASTRTDNAVSYNMGMQIKSDHSNKYIDSLNADLTAYAKNYTNMSDSIFKKETADKTVAVIGDGGSITATKGDISVIAKDELTLYTTAGEIGGSGVASIGVSAAIGIIAGTAEAQIGGRVQAEGNVIVKAYNIIHIEEFAAVGGGGSGVVTVNGTVTVLTIKNAARAVIAKAADVTAGNNVVVYADTDLLVRAINGNVGGAGTTAVGAAVNVVVIQSETAARILADKVTAYAKGDGVSFIDGNVSSELDGDFFNTQINKKTSSAEECKDNLLNIDAVNNNANETLQKGVLVGAHSKNRLYNYVAAAGGSGVASVMGSVNVLTFAGNTIAEIVGTTVKTDKQNDEKNAADIVVIAIDNTAIQDIIGQISGAGIAAVGIANETMVFKNNVTARIVNANLDSSRNIIMQATNQSDILNTAVGCGGGMVSVNDSNVIIVMSQKTEAIVDAGKLMAGGSIRIYAENNQDLYILAGSAQIGAGAVGAGVISVVNDNTVKANIKNNSEIDSRGAYSLKAYSGEFTNDGTNERAAEKKDLFGIFIGVYAGQNITSTAFSGSGGAIAAAAAVNSVVNTNTVIASTDSGTKINKNVTKTISPNADVIVTAFNNSKVKIAAGSGSAGGATIGAGVTVYNTTSNTQAAADGDIYTSRNLIVVADQNTDITVMAIGAAVAGVDLTNTTVVFNLASNTESFTSGKLDVSGLKIKANTYQNVDAESVLISVSVISVNAAVNVINFNAKTKAYMKGTANGAVTLYQDAEMIATSTEKIKAKADSKNASGISGVAGVLVVNMEVETRAYTEDNVVISTGKNAMGNLNITAKDDAWLQLSSNTTAISVGGSGNAAVAVVTFNNTVVAEIGKNNRITVNELNLKANTKRTFKECYVASGAATGLLGVNGSVFIISVGAPLNDTEKNSALSNTKDFVASAMETAKTTTQIKNDAGYGQLNGADIISLANQAAAKLNIDTDKIFTGSDLTNSTSTRIGEGSVVNIKTKADMSATDATELEVEAGANSASLGVSASGSVLLVDMKANTLSIVDGTIQRLNETAKAEFNISADHTIKAEKFTAYTGAGGLIGALGTAVAKLDIRSIVQANVSEKAKLDTGNVTVNASQKSTIKQVIENNTISGIISAPGPTIASLNQESNVEASVAASKANTGNITVNARSEVNDYVSSTAASGGLLYAGASTNSEVHEQSTTKAEVKGNINAKGNIDVNTVKIISVTAEPKGTSVGGAISTGYTYTLVEVVPTVTALVSGDISADGKISVYALYNKEKDGNKKGGIKTNGSGSIGSLLGSGVGLVTDIYQGISKNGIKRGEINSSISGNIVTGSLDVYSSGYSNIDQENMTTVGALGGAIGSITNTIRDKMTIKASTDGTVLSKGDVHVKAENESKINATELGLAGGVIVASDKLILDIDADRVVLVDISGNINAGGNLSIEAVNNEDLYGIIEGYNTSGVTALGDSELTIKQTNDVKVKIRENATLHADGILTLRTDNKAQKDGSSYASVITGIVANANVKENYTANYKTTIDAVNVTLEAGTGIMITANGRQVILSEASESLGGLLAYGNGKEVTNVNAEVIVDLSNSKLDLRKGDIVIEAKSDVDGQKIKINGGAGEAAGKTDEIAEANINQNVQIKLTQADILNRSTGKIEIGTNVSGNLNATGILEVDAWIETTAKSTITTTNTATSKIILDYTSIRSDGDVTLKADYGKMNSSIKNEVYTKGTFYAQAKATSRLNETLVTLIEGNATIVSGGELNIRSGHETDPTQKDINTRAEAIGKAKGWFGGSDVYSENNTSVTSNISLKAQGGKNTVLKGKNVTIFVGAPNQNEVEYSSYKSGSGNVGGSYNTETVEDLNCDIYCGYSAPMTIIVDKNGSISNTDVKYSVNKDNTELTIIAVSAKENGKVNLISKGGKIRGTVNLMNNRKLEDVAIHVYGKYNVKIQDINFEYLKSLPDQNSFMNISAADSMGLHTNNVLCDNTSAAENVKIVSYAGGDVTIDQVLLIPKGTLSVSCEGEKGNLYTGEKGAVIAHKLYLYNVGSLGSINNPFNYYATLTKVDGVLEDPKSSMDVSDNIYISYTLTKYMEVENEAERTDAFVNNKSITTDKNVFGILKVTGDIVLNINPAMLMIADKSDKQGLETKAAVEAFEAEKVNAARDGNLFTAELKDGTYGFNLVKKELILKPGITTLYGTLYLEKIRADIRFTDSRVASANRDDLEESLIDQFISAGKNVVINANLYGGSLMTDAIIAAENVTINMTGENAPEMSILLVRAGKKIKMSNLTGEIYVGFGAAEEIDLFGEGTISAIRLYAPSIRIITNGDFMNPKYDHMVEFGQLIADSLYIRAAGNVGNEEYCIESRSLTPGNLLIPDIKAGGKIYWHDKGDNFSTKHFVSNRYIVRTNKLVNSSVFVYTAEEVEPIEPVDPTPGQPEQPDHSNSENPGKSEQKQHYNQGWAENSEINVSGSIARTPKTGDAGDRMYLYILLMILAGITVIGFFRRKGNAYEE